MLTLPDPPANQDAAAVRTELAFSKYAMFVLVPLTLLFGYLGILAYGSYRRAKRTEFWPTTAGAVTKVEFHDQKNSQWTEVQYAYQVDGVDYTGDRVSYNRDSTGSKSAQSFAKEHPIGSEVTVHYNPLDHSDALLRPGTDMVSELLLVAPVILFIIIASSVYSTYTYRRFVRIVKQGNIAVIKDLCYNLKYGDTPVLALLAAAEIADDAILKEVIKGATPKEIAKVLAYCGETGKTNAFEKLSKLKTEESPKTKAQDSWRAVKVIVKVLAVIAPLAAWITYIVMTKSQ